MRLLIIFLAIITPLIAGAQGGGAGNDCPDDLNGPNANNNPVTVHVFDDNGDLVDSILCNVAGGSGNINCDLSSFPDTYFFVYSIEDDNSEIDCFYDGDGEQIDPIPLPVNIIDFSIIHTKDYNMLNWTTLEENDNDFFTIEYSMNGIDWYHLTDVKGNGTTNLKSFYEYEHRVSGYEIIYYRLSQTDFDGTSTKLSTKAVQSSTKEPIGISFNNSSINITSKEPINTVKIIDLSGRVVYDELNVNATNKTLSVDFNMGIYIVSIFDIEGNKMSQKFSIQ